MRSSIQEGDTVCIIHDDEGGDYVFDVGEVVEVTEQFVTVDFWDWIERWAIGKIKPSGNMWQADCWETSGRGEIITDFGKTIGR